MTGQAEAERDAVYWQREAERLMRGFQTLATAKYGVVPPHDVKAFAESIIQGLDVGPVSLTTSGFEASGWPC